MSPALLPPVPIKKSQRQSRVVVKVSGLCPGALTLRRAFDQYAHMRTTGIMMESLFFELLQVSIGNRKELTVSPSAEQWAFLFSMCRKQTLAGIAFVGIQRLSKGQCPPTAVVLQWIALARQIKVRNAQVNQECDELCKRLVHDGFRCCVLKGQGNLVNYPGTINIYRTPGDIDVWCSPTDNGIGIAVADFDGKAAHYEAYHGQRAVIDMQ